MLDPHSITVRFSDGSEYVVVRTGIEDAVHNANVSFVLTDGTGTGFLFNRLVDVDAVESVSVTWSGVVDGVPHEAEYVYAR